MDNIKIFDLNLWDFETLESSSEADNLPDTNTQDRWKLKPWRTTGDTSEYVRTAGASALEASGFFVFYHNVTAGGIVRLKGSDDNWGTTPLSEVMTRSANCYVYIPTAPITYDDYGVWVADAANPDGYIELGRIWIGDCYTPSPGYNPDIMKVQVDPSAKMESTGGQVSILERTKYHTWTIPFDCITDKDRYDTFIDRVGISKPFVILKTPKNHYLSTYPNPEDNSHYVHLQKHSESPLAGDFYQANLRIQEER